MKITVETDLEKVTIEVLGEKIKRCERVPVREDGCGCGIGHRGETGPTGTVLEDKTSEYGGV